jgi:hypothetical protein
MYNAKQQNPNNAQASTQVRACAQQWYKYIIEIQKNDDSHQWAPKNLKNGTLTNSYMFKVLETLKNSHL